MEPISGFSSLSKEEKIQLVSHQYFPDPQAAIEQFKNYWHHNILEQKRFDEFSENTLSNFYLPFGVAPNFLINGKMFCVPMVIEESSVVAAASRSAKFWLEKDRGGFHTEVISTHKVGQVHFLWAGKNKENLQKFFNDLKPVLLQEVSPITANMKKRGGGIVDVTLEDKTSLEKNYYQLFVKFETCDAMGANFINSVLEKFAHVLVTAAAQSPFLDHVNQEKEIQIIMSILSNYTPECLVRAWVECPIENLESGFEKSFVNGFAEKFAQGIRIAEVDVYRATTHNKGIFNGIDSVILATGNDFRAVEACGHAYASRSGNYRGLTHLDQEKFQQGIFHFSLEVPLSLGTVGGITSLHPLARAALTLLGYPKASTLMGIAAAVGLAQNFAAVSSLVTTGIQKGHMRMHLLNILAQLGANDKEREKAVKHFSQISGDAVSFMSVRNFLQTKRKN